MENIQVAIRVRPLNKKEQRKNYENIWEIPKRDTITLSSSNSRDYFASKKINCTGRTAFYFDQCFSPENNNILVYQQSVKRIVLSSLNGINGTIFMYGQTGSGKTYTMMGYNRHENHENSIAISHHERDISPNYRSCPPLRSKSTKKNNYTSGTENYQSLDQSSNGSYIITDVTENTGVLVMALRDIFETIENDMDKTYFLRCSYVEIYNDQIFDLLKTAERLTETLAVSEDSNKEFYIKGVTEESISSIEEVLEKLKKGETNRHYARTAMNHSSSRSHAIFRLTVQSVTNSFIREYRREKSRSSTNINNLELRRQFNSNHEGDTKKEGTIVTESLLNFVDLAGSEKVTHHQMLLEDSGSINIEQGGIYGKDSMLAVNRIKERVKEGQHINKSLFFLTQVISLKSEGKNNQYIPYRNSPLTKILRSSLGGNSRTLIVLCITPACAQFEQTMSTLRFGMSAKKIENKVQANIVTRDDDAGLKLLISDYEKKLKDAEIARQEEHSKYHNVLRQVEELLMQKNNLLEKVNNCYKIKITKMADSISQDDLITFYKQVKERNIHVNRVGVVFSCQNLTKYDKLIGSSTPRTSLTRRKREFEREEETSKGPLRDEVESKVEAANEPMNRLYSKFLKVYKEQNELLRKKLDVYEKNIEAVCERNTTNYSNSLQSSAGYETLKNQLVEVTKNCKQQTAKAKELQISLNLYKELKGMTELNEDELTILEKSFWEKLDQIKMERARRIIMKEMTASKENAMNQKLEYSSRKGSVNQQKIIEQEEEWIYFEENESASDHVLVKMPAISANQLEQINQEKEDVKNLLFTGIEDIDKQLEATKKALLDNRQIIELVQQQDLSDNEGTTKRTIMTRRAEKGDKTDRDASLSSYRHRQSMRKRSGSGNQNTGIMKPSQASNKLGEVVPKLDLGTSVGSITIEHDLPKLSIDHGLNNSTKRVNKVTGDSSQNTTETDCLLPLKSQRRGRIEAREVNNYSFDSKELKDTSIGRNEDVSVGKPAKTRSLVFMEDIQEATEKPVSKESFDSVKSQERIQPVKQRREKENKKHIEVNHSNEKLVEKITGSTALAKQYHSNPGPFTHLQNKLTKHFASLEKYFNKPVSTTRRSRSMRSDQNSITHYVTTAHTVTDSSLVINKSKIHKEESEIKKLEEEFEYEDDTEGDHKVNKSVVEKDSEHKDDNIEVEKEVIPEDIEDPCSNEGSRVEDAKLLLEIREPLPDKFGLNITNIDKEETMFTNSIFSLKEFDGGLKEKENEAGVEGNNVLKQLENILVKEEPSTQLGDCSDFPLNESKKRRKRADRLKKSTDKVVPNI